MQPDIVKTKYGPLAAPRPTAQGIELSLSHPEQMFLEFENDLLPPLMSAQISHNNFMFHIKSNCCLCLEEVLEDKNAAMFSWGPEVINKKKKAEIPERAFSSLNTNFVVIARALFLLLAFHLFDYFFGQLGRHFVVA